MALFQRINDPVGLADCLAGLGNVLMWRRELSASVSCYERALALYQESGDSFKLGQTLKGLANVYQCRDDFAEAQRFLERAKKEFEQLGNRRDVGGCLNDLGENDRLRGQLEAAEDHYRRAVDIMADANLLQTSTPRINLALVLLARAEFAEAEEVLRNLSRAYDDKSSSLEMLWIDAGMLVCAAARADWTEWDKLAGRVNRQMRDSGIIDEDIPWCANLAADLALDAGEDVRAAIGYRLALDQWRAASRDEEAAEVEEYLAALQQRTRRTP